MLKRVVRHIWAMHLAKPQRLKIPLLICCCLLFCGIAKIISSFWSWKENCKLFCLKGRDKYLSCAVPCGRGNISRVTFKFQTARGAWVARVMLSGSWNRGPCWAPCSAGSLLLPLPLSPLVLSLLLVLSNKWIKIFKKIPKCHHSQETITRYPYCWAQKIQMTNQYWLNLVLRGHSGNCGAR